jgi:hypothetical protein
MDDVGLERVNPIVDTDIELTEVHDERDLALGMSQIMPLSLLSVLVDLFRRRRLQSHVSITSYDCSVINMI